MTTPITITTFTGRVVDLLDPKPDTICLEDIARGLAMQCRFNGHIRRFYSVAEHSWRVTQHVASNPETRDTNVVRAAFLHDAAEAYVGDLIGPMKYALRAMERDAAGLEEWGLRDALWLSSFDQIEHRLLGAIGQRFGVTLWPMPALVKQADEHLYEVECAVLRGAAPLSGIDGADLDFGWDWASAEDRFLRAAEELGIR